MMTTEGRKSCMYRHKLVQFAVKLYAKKMDKHQGDQPSWDALSGREPTCCALASRQPEDTTRQGPVMDGPNRAKFWQPDDWVMASAEIRQIWHKCEHCLCRRTLVIYWSCAQDLQGGTMLVDIRRHHAYSSYISCSAIRSPTCMTLSLR